jgi:hypothetical protein
MEVMSKRLGETLFADPLSDVSRKDRRSLLGLSVVGFAITRLDLLPSKVEALGLVFNSLQKTFLIGILAAVVTYFCLAFLIHSGFELYLWRWSLASVPALRGGGMGDPSDLGPAPSRFAKITATWGRMLIDFLLPLLLGTWAVAVLWGRFIFMTR